MQPVRPKNLNLFTISFPIPAIVSILHRVSGFILFLLVPLMIAALNYSLTWRGFERLQIWIHYPLTKFILWLLFIPFFFHLIAGIRHLLMDIHIGETKSGGRTSAIITCVITLICVLLTGILLW